LVRRYVNIKIPEELAHEIDRIIEGYQKLSYRSRAEFVVEAIRNRILDIASMPQHETESSVGSGSH